MTNPAIATQIPVGLSFSIDFQIFQSRVTFESEKQLMFEILTGSAAGLTQTIDYQAITLRPGLFAVSWQEPSNATVVHIEDFSAGQVHANITQPDGTFLRLSGEIIALS